MFAQQLKSIMKEQGITQTELSQKTGLSKSGISQYLSGTHKPGMNALSVIAKALNVPEEYLDEKPKKIRQPIKKIRPEDAARIMGQTVQSVRIGIQNGTLPIGNAIQMGTRYSYYISPFRLADNIGISVEVLCEMMGLSA